MVIRLGVAMLRNVMKILLKSNLVICLIESDICIISKSFICGLSNPDAG